MAKDAADRGQILEESDLEDSAIMLRLGQDQKFRAAATRLLQSYGYLLPKVNLDSELGREQAAIEQEHIRQVVADEAARHAERVNASSTACQPGEYGKRPRTARDRPNRLQRRARLPAEPASLQRSREIAIQTT